MNELWVARDMDGEAAFYTKKPIWDAEAGVFDQWGNFSGWISEKFAKALNLRPGECKRLVLVEETS